MKQIRVHVSVVLQKKDCFLLVKEQKPQNYGRWNLPGGHLEHGEPIQQGAIREIREETGLRITLSNLVGIYTSIDPPDYHAIRFVFTAKHENKEPIPGDEILGVEWYTLEELETMPTTDLVGEKTLCQILHHAQHRTLLPLSTFTEPFLSYD